MDSSFKEILVLVAGTTPQIITETIYALSQKNPPIIPDKVYIITTTTGKNAIENTILKRNILSRLKKEYNLPEITIDESSFIIPVDVKGRKMADIRNNEENEIMGDTITSFIREMATDKRCRLHCSIAGGRKTMSFYLGAALQLFGRPWDRLYHVLITPEFESNPNFFYKPRRDRAIEVRLQNGELAKMSTKDAVIEIAELPFIHLAGRLNLQGKSFKELVMEGQKEIDIAMIQEPIVVNLKERRLFIGSTELSLNPIELLIYTQFLRRKKYFCKNDSAPDCHECTDCFVILKDLWKKEYLSSMAEDYFKIYSGNREKAEALIERWSESTYPSDIIRQHISKINRNLKNRINDKGSVHFYKIDSIRQYGGTRYGIRVEKKKIEIVT
ncbi:MAG: CRISPR-associated ring nuclease Csm6 [Syntrophorhabdaceae bacterium]|nr:CRISPR-associated ring nuclease Csm6 [Syntrophorhabdaceae bacterium]